jgi:transcriptional regulator with XRE-family HTH domain
MGAMGAHTRACTLGATIRDRRRELGWSQEELAERVRETGGRMRQSDVSRLEQGRVVLPHADRLGGIAAALGLPVGELLAHSGWTGAEVAFTSAAAPETVAAVALPEHDAGTRAARTGPARPPQRPREVVAPRLREAIARARETEAWTVEILDRCALSAATWDAPRQDGRRN